MNLAQLINILEIPSEISAEFCTHSLTQSITSIHYRSQDTRSGGLFVAIKGFTSDGHDFIADAVKNGAVAICAQRSVPTSVPVLVVPDTRKALALIAAGFYGYPAHSLRVIGVTGTSGKTTVAYLLESIFSAAGYDCGVIGTNNYRFAGKVFPNPVTTPESLDLQRILANMRDAGISHVMMEVSSHALDLHRVNQCDMDIGIFTNLSQDHLDYHEDMTTYWACKKRLFYQHLKSINIDSLKAQAVINYDNEYGHKLYHELPLAKLSTGMALNADIRALNPQISQSGTTVRIETPDARLNVASALVGKHNLENILSAVGAAVAYGIDLKAIENGINRLKCVPGRLERVSNNKNRHVYVDYAHKPDALEKVLKTLRPLLAGRLICVMGCGGDRDKTKRPIMGKIAERLADLTIVTSDNPRSESPEAIIAQIVEGVTQSKGRHYTSKEVRCGLWEKGYVTEPDRKTAIRLAVAGSTPGDTILIAGKGHETYQILGKKIIPFDDVHEAKLALGVERAKNDD